jgi:hypothetical protein
VDNGCYDRGLIYGLIANSAKVDFTTVRRATVRTDRFEPHPAVGKKASNQTNSRTDTAGKSENQSQLGCNVPNSIQAITVHIEGNNQRCIILGYAKSKLKE